MRVVEAISCEVNLCVQFTCTLTLEFFGVGGERVCRHVGDGDGHGQGCIVGSTYVSSMLVRCWLMAGVVVGPV